jgi:hypothetical protein
MVSAFQRGRISVAAPQADWSALDSAHVHHIAQTVFQIKDNMGRNQLVDVMHIMCAPAPPVRRVLQKLGLGCLDAEKERLGGDVSAKIPQSTDLCPIALMTTWVQRSKEYHLAMGE